jgi:hypothetical protein
MFYNYKGEYTNTLIVGRIESLSNDFPRIPQTYRKDLFLDWLTKYKNDLVEKKEKAKKEKECETMYALIIKIATCEDIEIAYKALK